MNQFQSKSNFIRYGVCTKCGKLFKASDDNKDIEITIIDMIKEYWKPDICEKCRKRLVKEE